MASDKLIELNESNWDAEVLNSDMPVLVDFWAVWCGPCKMLTPLIEEMSDEYKGKYKVGAVDVDKNQGIAVKYGIRSIPTLIIFKNGEAQESIIGVVPKDTLKSKMDEQL